MPYRQRGYGKFWLHAMGTVGDRIREAAGEVGGLNRLSDLIGVPRRTLGNWLTGTRAKPEGLRKIAEVSEVSLGWLVSGDGDKYPPARLEREAEEDRERQAFEASFSRAMRMVDRKRLSDDPLYEMEIRSRAPQFDIALLERLARMVVDDHREASIRISAEKVSVVAGDLYNELMARLILTGDKDEIEAVLTRIHHLHKQRLAEAVSKPGTGKRSAS